MSYTPFNAPLLSGLLGDPETTGHFTVRAEITAMLRFEAALAAAEADCGVISREAAFAIEAACETFEPDLKAIGAGTARDGLPVPEFVAQLRRHVEDPHGGDLHHGSTSQDVIDTAMVLRMTEVLGLFAQRLTDLDDALQALADRFGSNELMARTRMQAALPFTVGDRIRTWSAPLADHRTRLGELRHRFAVVQFGGAIGTLNKLSDKGADVRAKLAERLGLSDPGRSWHGDRSVVAEMADWLSLVTGTLGKMGQDVALMAQNEMGEIELAGGGGSSAMPHKQNPVKAEVLVTLARFNAVQVGGFHQALVHEQERSGAAWTLEWMLLPQMAVATGAALRTAIELTGDIEAMGGSGE